MQTSLLFCLIWVEKMKEEEKGGGKKRREGRPEVYLLARQEEKKEARKGMDSNDGLQKQLVRKDRAKTLEKEKWKRRGGRKEKRE